MVGWRRKKKIVILTMLRKPARWKKEKTIRTIHASKLDCMRCALLINFIGHTKVNSHCLCCSFKVK